MYDALVPEADDKGIKQFDQSSYEKDGNSISFVQNHGCGWIQKSVELEREKETWKHVCGYAFNLD